MNDQKHEQDTEVIEKKILHLLKVYPLISHTMLQGGLGPQYKPVDWRPVLRRLLKEGKIIEEQDSMETPFERYNTYTKLRLPGTIVTVAEDAKAV